MTHDISTVGHLGFGLIALIVLFIVTWLVLSFGTRLYYGYPATTSSTIHSDKTVGYYPDKVNLIDDGNGWLTWRWRGQKYLMYIWYTVCTILVIALIVGILYTLGRIVTALL